MHHTPQFGLSQWEKTDRILMDDFNNDNLKIEAALLAMNAVKSEIALLVDRTAASGTAGYSSFPIDGSVLGQYMFLFWEFTHSDNTSDLKICYLSNGNYPITTLKYGRSGLISFPMRNPENEIYLIPVLNPRGSNGTSNLPYKNLDHIYLFPENGSASISGTQRIRIWGIK